MRRHSWTPPGTRTHDARGADDDEVVDAVVDAVVDEEEDEPSPPRSRSRVPREMSRSPDAHQKCLITGTASTAEEASMWTGPQIGRTEAQAGDMWLKAQFIPQGSSEWGSYAKRYVRCGEKARWFCHLRENCRYRETVSIMKATTVRVGSRPANRCGGKRARKIRARRLTTEGSGSQGTRTTLAAIHSATKSNLRGWVGDGNG